MDGDLHDRIESLENLCREVLQAVRELRVEVSDFRKVQEDQNAKVLAAVSQFGIQCGHRGKSDDGGRGKNRDHGKPCNWRLMTGRRGSRYHARLDVRRWAQVRRRVFDVTRWRCVDCGRAGRLECDHVVPLHRGGDPYDSGKLQTLCRTCHIDKTAGENTRPDPGARRDGAHLWRKYLQTIVRHGVKSNALITLTLGRR